MFEFDWKWVLSEYQGVFASNGCNGVPFKQLASRCTEAARQRLLRIGGVLFLATASPALGLADSRGIVPRLAAEIEQSLTTHYPHESRRGPAEGIFLGSYDWHSSVHGTWALLSMIRQFQSLSRSSARLSQFPEYVGWNSEVGAIRLPGIDSFGEDQGARFWRFLEGSVLGRLDARNLGAERRFLSEHPGFELPYGQAWLLLLLEELPRVSGVSQAQLEEANLLREATRQRLHQWLRRYAFPELRRGQFLKTHTSWLMNFYLVSLSDQLSELRQPGSSWHPIWADLYHQRVRPVMTRGLQEVVMAPADFVFIPSLMQQLGRIYGESPLPPYRITWNPPSLPLTAANQHRPGAAVMSLWAAGQECRWGDLDSCRFFDSAWNSMVDLEWAWRGSFEWVSHYVPQFMWMAWLQRTALGGVGTYSSGTSPTRAGSER